MKYLILVTLIQCIHALNNTTTQHPMTTTHVPNTTTTTVVSTTTHVPTTTTTTEVPTTTTTYMESTTTTQLPSNPLCSENTTNTTCEICMGKICHSFTVEERDSMMELFFITCVLSLCGFVFLGLYYMCIKPIFNNNVGDDILWSDTDSSDDEEFVETIQLIKKQHFTKPIHSTIDESV